MRDLVFAQVKARRLGPSIARSTGQSHRESGGVTGDSVPESLALPEWVLDVVGPVAEPLAVLGRTPG